MCRLALPYDRFAPCRAPAWSRHKPSQVFQNPNGAESEPGSDFSPTSDVTSDLTDVTSDVTNCGSVPPSPGALKNIEQGTLGVVVGGWRGGA